MANKDFGRRLIPEYLLKYSEDLRKNHPDPSASWGGGSAGGGDYTAGYGIKIDNKDISIDQNVVASKSDIITSYNDLTDKPTIPTKTSDLQNDSGFINGVAWDDVKNKPTFATVATSGSYNDLTDKPYIIPSSRVVTTDEIQTISAVKTFEGNIKIKEVTGAQTTAILPDTFDYTQINPSTREKSRTKFKLPTSKSKGTADAPTEYTLATTDDIPNVPTLATVATTGSYNDLIDKPTIPAGTTNPFLRVTDANDTVFFSLTGAAQTFYKSLDLKGQPPVHVNLRALNPVYGNGLTSTYNSSNSQLEVAVDTSVVALKSDIPDVPSMDNVVTTDTAQTITGLKTIGQTSGTLSEVDFSGFTFKLVNKAINSTEAEIKISNASYDGNQHPHIYSTKGLYVNLAKIRLGDDGSNTYGIKMPDSSTWDSDRVLATTADIPSLPVLATVATSGSYNDLTDKPTIPTVNDSTITFTQGGVTKGSFSLNQATNQTIELDAGGAQAPAFEITNMVVDSSAQTITLTITQNN